jgi:hypothetical protein
MTLERVCDSVTLKIMAAAFDNALTGERRQKAATPPKPSRDYNKECWHCSLALE